MKKTILITGATSELGKAISEFLIKQGYRLILTARSLEKLSALSEQLKKQGGEIKYVASDFTDSNTFNHVIALLEKSNLSGMLLMPPQAPATSEPLPDEEIWHKLLNTSLVGPAVFIKKVIPCFTKNARVLLISGISSRQPVSHYATSNILRTAWLGLLKTIADQYGPKAIHFNTLSIGGIMTEKFKKQIESEAQNSNTLFSEILSGRLANVPLRRYAELDEIAEMASFLLTSSAGQHMTGQNIVFDGGFTRPY